METYIPLNFWLTREPAIKYEIDDSNFNMCKCSHEEVIKLCKMSKKERVVDGTSHPGMKQIVSLPYFKSNFGKVEDLGPEGKELVQTCLEFLQLMDEKTTLRNSLEWRDYWTKLECTNFHRFIFTTLGIKEDGYDFWLLNFLEWNSLIEHGSTIANCWIKKNILLTNEKQIQLLDML